MTWRPIHHSIPRTLGLATLGWLACVLFLDRGVAFQAVYFHAPGLRALLDQMALAALPLPWVALTVAWGVVVGRRVARRALFIVTAWAATTLIVDVLSIVVGHYQPRAWLDSLVSGEVIDPILQVPFLGNSPEALWGLLAGAMIVSPRWRPVLLAVGIAASALRVMAGEVYLGDSLLAAGLAVAAAAAMLPLFAEPESAQSADEGGGARPSIISR